jgi:hypothetical protein
MKILLALVATVVAAVVVGGANGKSTSQPLIMEPMIQQMLDQITPDTIYCSVYYLYGDCGNPGYGNPPENTWKSSLSQGRRINHHAFAPSGYCLPGTARYRLRNTKPNGVVINKAISPFGWCGTYSTPLSSSGVYAFAECMVQVFNGGFNPTVACATDWY